MIMIHHFLNYYKKTILTNYLFSIINYQIKNIEIIIMMWLSHFLIFVFCIFFLYFINNALYELQNWDSF